MGTTDERRYRREVPGRGRWSWEVAEIFFLALAQAGNVRAAARAAGYTTAALYWRRRRYPAFAAAWAFALDEGRAREQARYLSALTRRTPFDGGREGPVYTSVGQALHQLYLHRGSVRGGKVQRYDHHAKPPDWETVRASILRKIDAIERVDRWRKVKGFDE